MPTTPPSRNHIPLVDLAALTADAGRPLPLGHRRPPLLKVRAPWVAGTVMEGPGWLPVRPA